MSSPLHTSTSSSATPHLQPHGLINYCRDLQREICIWGEGEGKPQLLRHRYSPFWCHQWPATLWHSPGSPKEWCFCSKICSHLSGLFQYRHCCIIDNSTQKYNTYLFSCIIIISWQQPSEAFTSLGLRLGNKVTSSCLLKASSSQSLVDTDANMTCAAWAALPLGQGPLHSQLHGHGDTTGHVSTVFVTIYFYSLATEQLFEVGLWVCEAFFCVLNLYSAPWGNS